MKTSTSIQAIVLICLSSCGPEDANDRNTSTPTPSKSVEVAQKPTVITPKPATEIPRVEVPSSPSSIEKPESIMKKRKSSDFESASKQFGELLQQSSIVGKPITEVKALLGRPDAETETSISYRFEAGYGGWDWVLDHDGRNVLGFTRKGVN